MVPYILIPPSHKHQVLQECPLVSHTSRVGHLCPLWCVWAVIAFSSAGCGDLLCLVWMLWVAEFVPVLLRDPSEAAMGFLVGRTGSQCVCNWPCATVVGTLDCRAYSLHSQLKGWATETVSRLVRGYLSFSPGQASFWNGTSSWYMSLQGLLWRGIYCSSQVEWGGSVGQQEGVGWSGGASKVDCVRTDSHKCLDI